MISLNQIADVAKKAAARAREVQVRGLREGTRVRSKGTPQDLVTAADEEAERVIARTVAEAFPDHNLLGEEGGDQGRSSEWLWVVDPIDGTTNYARGVPWFSTSIAVQHRGRTVVGLVLNGATGEEFLGVEGQGAFVDGAPARVSAVSTYEQALLITGFYYDRGPNIDLTLAGIRTFYDRGILGIRRFGSAALDLCYLAAGRADGYFEIGLNPWDFAAGAFIATLAGARVTDALGQDLGLRKSYLIAGNPAVHALMMADLVPWQAAQKAAAW